LPDYKELLGLALIFLDIPPVDEQQIIVPGAFHRVQWMGKLIYCLKIYLIRSQFNLTVFKLLSRHEFNLFCSSDVSQGMVHIPASNVSTLE
jgi:hypothetical protein